MLLSLIAIPLLAGAAALALEGESRRPWLLPLGALAHSALVLRCWTHPPDPAFGGWLSLDPLGLLLLSVASALFLGCSVYALDYLRTQEHDNRLFSACFLVMLAAASLVALSRHMALLWVGMEATTLAGAPMIHFHRSDRSLEAAWKYLILCSVGVGLALLGTFFLALAGGPRPGEDTLLLDALLRRGPALELPWVKGAFVFLLVGYGTKMGLAPLHSWLPDAHGESPSLVSALLSGVLLNCAFLGILRAYQVCAAAGLAGFARGLLVPLGLLSMAVAAVFILGQRDLKRMLAYSSVEHMGILALGLGLGPAGAFPALLHLVNNALTKGLLFLTAGNLQRSFGGKTLDHVQGALRRAPVSAALFLAGFIAITGTPPFGPFLSEFGVLRAAVSAGPRPLAAAYLALLAVVFIGMAQAAFSAVWGEPPKQAQPGDSPLKVAAPLALAAAVLLLGLYIPGWLSDTLTAGAVLLGANP